MNKKKSVNLPSNPIVKKKITGNSDINKIVKLLKSLPSA